MGERKEEDKDARGMSSDEWEEIKKTRFLISTEVCVFFRN